jgi:uncharacterized protein (DUF885 family)
MHPIRKLVGLVAAVLLVLAPLAGRTESGSTRSLNAIADDFMDARTKREFRPVLSDRGNAAWVNKIEGFERRLANVKTSRLDPQSRITYRMLKNDLKFQREFITKGWIMEDGQDALLLTPTYGLDQNLTSVNEWRWLIKTLKHTPRFVDGYIGLLRKGVNQDRTRCREMVQTSISSLKDLTTPDRRRNPFLLLEGRLERSLKGHRSLPALRRELRQVVEREVLPSQKRLQSFLEQEYLPRASRLGNNRQRYLYHMAQHLGPDHASPEALNRWGQREVKRLHRELERTVRQLNPKAASLSSFMNGMNRRGSNHYRDAQDLISSMTQEVKSARRWGRKMAPIPRTKVAMEPVAPHLEATMAAYYMPDGANGTMYCNTGKLLKGQRRYDQATLVAHELFGGHHQAWTHHNKQAGRLPLYRTYNANTTYDEGWALYAEQWRDKQGGFTPFERIGYLTGQLWRAARLVVDTGLHTGTMTPRQATEFFRKSTFTSPTNAKAEIERYISYPGQALAYMVGRKQLLQTKREVKRVLGRNFDERKFHTKLLSLAPVPYKEMRHSMLSWANRRAGQMKRTDARRSGPRRSGFYGRRHHQREQQLRAAAQRRPPRMVRAVGGRLGR